MVSAQDTPDIAQGFAPYAPFHHGDLDNINLLNGNLFLKIPLVSLPQRGRLALSFSVVYNSPTYHILTSNCKFAPCNFGHTDHTVTDMRGEFGAYVGTPFSPSVVLDQSLTVASVSTPEPSAGTDQSGYPINSSGHYFVVDSAGGQHELGRTGNNTYRSIDGAEYLLTVPSAQDLYPQGLGMTISDQGHLTSVIQSFGFGTITDSNGITYTGSTIQDPDGNKITGLLDSAGRNIPNPPSGPTTTDVSHCPTLNGAFQTLVGSATWSVPGLNGAPMNYIFCYTKIQIRTFLVFGTHSTITSNNQELSESQQMLQSIVLPNEQFWGFIYDAADPNNTNDHHYGMLTKLMLPTGGRISYAAGLRPGFCPVGVPAPGGPTIDQPESELVGSRTVSPNDGSSNTWTYSYLDNGGGLPVQTIVTQPTLDETVHSYAAGTDCTGLLETSVQLYQGSHSTGQLLSTSTTSYVTAPANYDHYRQTFSIPSQRLATLPSGGSSITSSSVYQYDPGVTFTELIGQIGQTGTGPFFTAQIPIGSMISQKDSDYTGILLRQTSNTFQWQLSSPFFTANLLQAKANEKILTNTGTLAAETDYTYDEAAKMVASGISTQHTIPLAGTPLGHVTTATHYLNTGTGPTSSTYWYDTGMVQKQVDPRGNTATTFGYDPLGAVVTSVTNAAGQATKYGYDTNLVKVISITDPNSNKTTYAYNDPLLRLTAVTDPGLTTPNNTFTYNDSALQVLATKTLTASPLVKADMTVQFDGLGREKQRVMTDPEGADTVDTSYDTSGRVASVSNPHRATGSVTDGITQTVYDALGRVTMTIPPDGTSTTNHITTAYSGNTTTVTDQAGVSRQTTADALGRVTQVTEGSTGWLTQYFYDTLGNLTCVEQHGGVAGTGCSSAPSNDAASQWRVRRFSYDSLSRLLTASNPESGTISYTYDLNGNVLTKTDGRPVTVNMTYDALNRLTQKSGPGISYTYVYDIGNQGSSIGRLTHASNNTGAAYNPTYDAMGRITSQIYCIPSDCSYGTKVSATYDLAGNLSTLTYPDARKLNYTYSTANRLVSVTQSSPSSSYVNVSSYWPAGEWKNAMLGNGTQQTDIYNNRLQPSELILLSPTNNKFADKLYSYSGGSCVTTGNNGNVCAITDALTPAHTQTFTYDAVNRILSAKQADNVINQTFSLDAWGNLKQSGTSSFLPASYSAQNRINGFGIAYDAAGNITKDQFAVTWVYDALNQITSNSGVGMFAYDSDGQRIRKAAGSTWTEYIRFGGNTIAEKNSNGTWSDYIFASGKRVAQFASGATTPTYYWTDHLGSTRIMTNNVGASLGEDIYAPFGQESGTSTLPTRYRFTGKERDASGLDCFGARYYASSVGRFMSPDWSEDADPIPNSDTSNPQSLNRYSYVQNSPLSNTDPDGHDCIYNNGDGTGYILRGDCASDSDNGVFVNGTIDANSFNYNATKNSSSFSYTTENGGIGTGVLQGENLNGGFEPGSLAAGLFGPQGAKYWNPAAGTVNALGSLEMTIMAPWAGAVVSCLSGASAGSCGASMAMALLPELKGIGIFAKDETAIAGVLKQIASGTTKGKVFENFAGSLPARAPGYYREYTVPLAGQVGRGAARLVTGAGGEIYYTADHYATFTRIK